MVGCTSVSAIRRINFKSLLTTAALAAGLVVQLGLNVLGSSDVDMDDLSVHERYLGPRTYWPFYFVDR